ncbi:MAG: hypothetical protein E6J91_14800 [Deltaproteobacteria bacterium]|nr:MAG: hypothetical protein E6J91_14800 [Deltaproteobacteria bacterium]
MAGPGPALTPMPSPGRALLRIAGVLTQLACGACLLIGTIGMVLAMAGLVFGGLIYRGGLVSMLVAAAIDAGFGIVLVTLEHDTLRRLLKILPPSDVATISDALRITGFAMIGVGAVCLIALPQGIRYARWFRDAAATRTAMSTARGFPPPPVPVRSSAYIIPAEHQPASRRRLYMVLGGLAIGAGAGIGVLVSSSRSGDASAHAPAITGSGSSGSGSSGSGSSGSGSSGSGSPSVEPRVPPDAGVSAATPPDAGAVATVSDAGAVPGAGRRPADGSGVALKPLGSVGDLMLAQHAAIARADAKAFAALLAASAFGFGVDAGEVADGRDAVAAQLARDLGAPPAAGFTIESKALAIGEDRGHAWIAEQLDVGGAGREPRSFAISELAAKINGSWQVVALHWAIPVDDATAERLAILSRLPPLRAVADRQAGSGELDQAVRAAFASRAAFADAHSERIDAFNYGSGGERAHGGAAIKRIFTRLKSKFHIRDGARVVAGGAWDPAQSGAPWIGWAALNVDYTSKTRAGTDVTQTFRVLAVLIREASGWKIVQTQWSNGGPIH